MEKQLKRQSSFATGDLLSEPGNHVYGLKQFMGLCISGITVHWFWKMSILEHLIGPPRLTNKIKEKKLDL